MAVLLFLQSTVVAFAAPNTNSVVRAISGYCLGDELYAFLQINEGYDIDSFTVSFQSDAASAAGGGRLVPVTETSTIVRYVFMVDRSGSMRKYADEVNAFVDALMETEKQETFYTVATFEECFEIVSENMTDPNTVKRVLGELKYTGKLTNPYTAVESALTYLDGCSRRSGDLIHLIVITDGDPALGIEDEEERRSTESALAESAAAKIQNAPEVIVSTICMAEWDADAFDALSAGSGIHEMIDDDQDAAAAGAKAAGYVDSLYRIDVKLSAAPKTERFSAAIKLRGNALSGQLAMFDIPLEGLPNLKLFSGQTQENPGADDQAGNGGFGIAGIIGGADEDGDKPQNEDGDKPGDEDGDKPEDEEQKEPGGEGAGEPGSEESAGLENEGADEAGSEESTGSGDEGAGEPGSEDSAGSGNEGADKSGDEGTGVPGSKDMQKLLWIGGICALVLIVGVCLIILVRKRKSRKKESQSGAENRQDQNAAAHAGRAAALGGGIGTGGLRLSMKLEVYAGNCVSRTALICLTDSLVIGSAPECDLVFRDQDVSPQNSRVFIKDQMIYIEDLNSAAGTALGGMRIQGQNRLRSGDVISIGNVEFSFKF